MKPVEKKYVRFRILSVGFILGIVLIIIGARAVYLQVLCNTWLSQKAANQYEKTFISRGKRGTIFDSNYTEMAVSIDVTSIAAYPKQIENPRAASMAIASALKLNRTRLHKRLASQKEFVWIKRKVTPRETEAVKDLNIKGVGFVSEQKRFYPNKTLAAQVIGFVGMDDKGLEGIEFYYDKYLKGSKEKLIVFKDAFGRRFASKNGPESAKDLKLNNGNNIVLTIDGKIQHITEKALEETVSRYRAKSGIAIVMVPQTGAVLAMAHFPFFNPNTFSRFDKEIWRNRAITDPFEPGSTMKIFTAAAGLVSGKCLPNTIFFCENGKYKIGSNIIHDTHEYRWISLQHIIKYSSNIGAVKIGEMIGPKVLYNNLRSFGFGERTNIDCPGETRGILSHFTRWFEIDRATIAFGQGVSVSAIQLLTAACAIANNGILMKPYIVQAITDQNGLLIKSFGPQKVRRVISPENAEKIIKMMKSVVSEEGTGVNAAIDGYSVCGKTGTAQKINTKGKYTRKEYTASFLGFVPADKPKLAILVVIDEPQKEHYGGVVAAPAFKSIAYNTIDYLNTVPYPDSPVNRMASWKACRSAGV